jgi:hypothetical protein
MIAMVDGARESAVGTGGVTLIVTILLNISEGSMHGGLLK